MSQNWTEESVANFLSRITFDFITQLDKRMDAIPLKQSELAKKLGVTEGSVSQILNNPSNLSLKTIVKYARALGVKVALVAYDDNDPENANGLINSEIFTASWERVGKPQDFFELNNKPQSTETYFENDATNVVFFPVAQTKAGIMNGGYTKSKSKV